MSHGASSLELGLAHTAEQIIGRALKNRPCKFLCEERTIDELLEERHTARLSQFEWWSEYSRRALDQSGDKLQKAFLDHLAILKLKNLSYVLMSSSLYPPLLRVTACPPLALSVLGNPSLLPLSGLTIVGTRHPSSFARKTAYELGLGLGALGEIVVVSGGAIGIDIASHLGALGCQSDQVKTVVVLAGGLSHLHPRSHAKIFNEIVRRGGALVSERLCGHLAKPHDFLTRNRILAGWSSMTILVEAGAKSGTMVTAGLALDEGRDVRVLAQDNWDSSLAGGKDLIDAGASSFRTSGEFFQDFELSSFSPA